MKPQIKIMLPIIVITLLALGCGLVQIGVEPTPTQPSDLSSTPTKTVGNIYTEEVHISEKKPTEAVTALTVTPGEEGPLGIDCSDFGIDPLISAACNIQDSFISRNTQPLLSYMPEEFSLGYWQSEWTTVTPEFAFDFFQRSLLPSDPRGLMFTTDRDKFPPMFGTPPDTMLGPDMNIALIIYSEGWGLDGQGAVLIFITGDETSGYRFPAMLVAGGHFDK